MTTLDTIIAGGTVVTASDTYRADIGIRDGRIAMIGTGLPPAAEVIDAAGLLVLPGGIDSHVHISQPGEPGVVMADDFESATRSALFGGHTTLLPFCLQAKGQSLGDAVRWYHGLAEGNCYTDVSFHLILTDPTPQVLGQELPALVEDGYTSVKVFMTYEGMKLSDREILQTLEAAKASGALCMVHAENDDMIEHLRDAAADRGDTAPKFHATTRPIPAEREATHRAIALAEVIDVPIVIVHVSNRDAIEEIRAGRRRGSKVFGETCPQYLVLTKDDLDLEGFDGAKYVCSPPPRDTDSQAACWEGLREGDFDVFSSDHCPYRFEDHQGKKRPEGLKSFRWVPNGIPGVETSLPILFSEGVSKGRIDLNRFVALTSTNHAKLYGLYPRKGTIAVGSDADIVLWDPERTEVIRQEILHHGADYTPYEGLQVQGWPVRTILRGRTAVNDGELIAKKGSGIYQKRALHGQPLV
ncbi:dihydropyrimidinase [Roseibacterium sp. SDUM158017]|uniref:dihydropyrimidinase n=1 Tax=Roseicyclus salinarum TaxID=3036773 RepID=UPI00241500C2|nr:dihydropyrimidinase [Roseibacterium sp. SDUM158017]MDG4650416.1 dihydropyrimidinase [Roseibacterium sp. SDUM158017]